MDETGEAISDIEIMTGEKKRKGHVRSFKIDLDPAQYYNDTENDLHQIYESFNIVIRRRPKENNFKAVLDTIKALMNDEGIFIILFYFNLF